MGRVERLAGIYYRRDDDSHHFVFRCTVESGAEPTPSSDEISDCAYRNIEELPRPISDFTIRRIRDALADRGPSFLVEVPTVNWLE